MKTYKLIIGGQRYEARVVEYSPDHAKININGTDYLIQVDQDSRSDVPVLPAQEQAIPIGPEFSSDFVSGSGEIRSPLPGVIVSIKVKEGDKLKKGQTIMVLEAMKMESEIAAPIDCVVETVHVQERAPVHEGDLLMTLSGIEKSVKPAAKPSPKQSARAPEPQVAVQPQDNAVRAPLPGAIIEVKVSPGQMIKKGDLVLTLEAMKMESEIHSSLSGRIVKVNVSKGDLVQEGDPLVELEVMP